MPDTVAAWGAFGDEQSDIGTLYALLTARPDWHARAACKEHPALPWIADRGERGAACLAVCARCSVRDECLDFALSADPPAVGVWGGTNAQQRAQMRRQAG